MQGRAVLNIGSSLSKYPEHSKFLENPAQGNLSHSANGNSTTLVSNNLQDAIKRAGRDFRSDTVTVPTEPVMQVGDNWLIETRWELTKLHLRLS